jgi:hypothetical protein
MFYHSRRLVKVSIHLIATQHLPTLKIMLFGMNACKNAPIFFKEKIHLFDQHAHIFN